MLSAGKCHSLPGHHGWSPLWARPHRAPGMQCETQSLPMRCWRPGGGAPERDQRRHAGRAERGQGRSALRKGPGGAACRSHKPPAAWRSPSTAAQQVAGACPRLAWGAGGAPGSGIASSGAAAPRTPRRNFPRLLAHSLRSGQPLPSRAPRSEETSGCRADISTPPRCLSPPCLSLSSREEGGVWPAAGPREQVWPFLGEHLKGSWQDPERIGEGAAGPTGNTPAGRESSRNQGGFLSFQPQESTCWQGPPHPPAIRWRQAGL